MHLCVAPVKEIRPKLASFGNWSRDDSGGRGSEHKLYRMWNHKFNAITRKDINVPGRTILDTFRNPSSNWNILIRHRRGFLPLHMPDPIQSPNRRWLQWRRPKMKKSSSKLQGTEDLKYLQAYSWWECWQCSWTCKGEIRTPIKSSSNAPYTSSFEKSKSTLHYEDHDADDNEEECVKLNSKLVLMVEELKGLVGKVFQVLLKHWL